MKNDEQTLVQALFADLIRERKTDRWLKNIRFLLWFCLIAFITYQVMRSTGNETPFAESHVALLRLDGMIASGRDFSADNVIPVLQDAFSDSKTVGVLININSPGGTPVQASIIHDEIVRLKNKYHKKVVVVGEDLLTSGAYFVAVAADRIYVNESTLTGSIGVVMKGFGFVDVLKKIGIERRVYISGNNKDRLDPFLPQNADDIKKIESVMEEVHQHFIKAVLAGRKGKLTVDPKTLFNGDFWSGSTALKLGLVDGLGNWTNVLPKEWGKTPYREYSGSNGLMRLLSGQITSAFDRLVYT